MSDIAIKVENLSKRYRIGLKDEMLDTFFTAMKSWPKAPLTSFKQLQKLTKFDDNSVRNSNPTPDLNDFNAVNDQSDIIWALNDVSFEVKHGEVIDLDHLPNRALAAWNRLKKVSKDQDVYLDS